MKVLHICQDYFGTNLYANMISGLNESIIENIVYVPLNNKVKSKIESSNIIISKTTNNIFQRLLFFPKQFKNYREIIENINIENIELVHAHNLFSGGYIAYMIFKKYKIPYIVTVRNTDVNVFFKYFIHLRKLGVNIMKYSKRVVFISPSYKLKVLNKHVSRSYNEIESKSIVIPNGIDDYFLNNIYIRENKPQKVKVNIIYIGEINENKNLTATIKACIALQRKGIDVRYRVVGEIQNKKIGLLLEQFSFIDYHSKCSKEEVMKHLRKSDIFVMPSKHETFGLVYAEALSQGLPIIYSKGQGFDGFFKQGEVGYAVHSTNSNEIVDSILKILDNYDNIHINCTNNVQQFNWKTIISKYIKIYED